MLQDRRVRGADSTAEEEEEDDDDDEDGDEDEDEDDADDEDDGDDEDEEGDDDMEEKLTKQDLPSCRMGAFCRYLDKKMTDACHEVCRRRNAEMRRES